MYFGIMLIINKPYLWEPMFVDYQKIAGLWGRKFMGKSKP